jgi:hypothetical protein
MLRPCFLGVSKNLLRLIKGSKTIQSKAEEKLRRDRTPSTVTSNFDGNRPYDRNCSL